MGRLSTQLSPTQANEVMSKPWPGPSSWNHPSPSRLLPHWEPHTHSCWAQREGEGVKVVVVPGPLKRSCRLENCGPGAAAEPEGPAPSAALSPGLQ